jgi:hypothetical protein
VKVSYSSKAYVFFSLILFRSHCTISCPSSSILSMSSLYYVVCTVKSRKNCKDDERKCCLSKSDYKSENSRRFTLLHSTWIGIGVESLYHLSYVCTQHELKIFFFYAYLKMIGFQNLYIFVRLDPTREFNPKHKWAPKINFKPDTQIEGEIEKWFILWLTWTK